MIFNTLPSAIIWYFYHKRHEQKKKSIAQSTAVLRTA